MVGSGPPKCGKCEGTEFRTQEIEPQGAAYKLIAVQCQRCDTPIGVLDYFNLGTLIKAQEQQIAELRTDLQQVHGQLGMIAHYIQQAASREP